MKVLKEILQELILIRKELQAIRRRMEFKPKLSIDGKAISEATRDKVQEVVASCRSSIPRQSR